MNAPPDRSSPCPAPDKDHADADVHNPDRHPSGGAVGDSALLVLARCSSSGSSSAAATGGHASGSSVTVGETEFALHLSQTSFSPGTCTFVAEDRGKLSHALAISGPGVPPGTAQLTVPQHAGSYELWCPVDSHKELGMDTRIQVGSTAISSDML